MRPTQKMMKVLVLPAPNRKDPEQPENPEPDAAVRAELEDLEKRERVIREIAGSAKFGELFAKGRKLVSELAANARTKRIQPGAVMPGGRPSSVGLPGSETPGGMPAELALPAGEDKERLAKIETAEKEALEEWKKIEAGARRTLDLRARRLEAGRKALALYLEAPKRGFDSPTPPRRPQKG